MKKLIALLVALLVLPMAFAQTYVTPGSPGTVVQQAQISGAGNPPTVRYAWVLPDESALSPETQLYPELSAERSDDIYACVVVSDPQGRGDIQNVYVDVYHPTGTEGILPCVKADGNKCDYNNSIGKPYDNTTADGLFKYQVHAAKLDVVTQRTDIEGCKTLAKNAGLITQAQYDEINYKIFSQPEWYMYKVYLPMLYHQPAGIYTIKAWATDTASGVSTPLTNTFEWVSTVALEIDFAAGLNYGIIQPSVYKVIQGNYDMGVSTFDGAPTVKNEGNERVQIGVSTTTLKGLTHQKEITDFDVKWDPEEKGFGYGQIYFTAGTPQTLVDPLELCQTEKIDFSVHAAVGLPADIYTGVMTITAAPFDGN